MKIFISYPFDNNHEQSERFIHRVTYYLKKQPNLEPYCYNEDRYRDDWEELVGTELMGCEKFVLFIGNRVGDTQKYEAESFKALYNDDLRKRTVVVALPEANNEAINILGNLWKFYRDPIKIDSTDLECAEELAKMIFNKLEPKEKNKEWITDDDLPIGYLFDYEKDIIEEFVQGNGYLYSPKRLEQGCPWKWPEVEMIKEIEKDHPNPIDENVIGQYRDKLAKIIVDARSLYHKRSGLEDKCCLADRNLTLLEAGPREKLVYPMPSADNLTIGIVVSGGIAPGINSVIAGIVQRHKLYERKQKECNKKDSEKFQFYDLKIRYYRDGFSGLLRGEKIRDIKDIDYRVVSEQSNIGGSMFSTSRHDELLEIADSEKRDEIIEILIEKIRNDDIDILYVIGGDGSMRAAHAIWVRAQASMKLSVVGIPKTMDNDILWVWQSFGFLSAVEKSKEFILQLHTEAKSNPRLCIVQLFGSDSGFVVSQTALASGVCMAALIPEAGFTMKELSNYVINNLRDKYRRKKNNIGQSPYGIVLLAETAIPLDVEEYIDNPNYPDLKLEEKEKEAIRKFIGSSLLNIDDITNWEKFCSEIVSQGNEKYNSMKRRIWELLPPEVQSIINIAPKAVNKSEEIKKLIILVLNKLLKKEKFYNENEDRDKQLPAKIYEAKMLLKSLNNLKLNKNSIKPEDINLKLKRLKSISLPYVAKEKLKKISSNLQKITDFELGALYKDLLLKIEASIIINKLSILKKEKDSISKDEICLAIKEIKALSLPDDMKEELDELSDNLQNSIDPGLNSPYYKLIKKLNSFDLKDIEIIDVSETLNDIKIFKEKRIAISTNEGEEDIHIKLKRLKKLKWSQNATEKLERLSNNLQKISDERLYSLWNDLIQKLTEKFNRQVLEFCFPNIIKQEPPIYGERRIRGQTPDEIRTGGLKIVSHVLQSDIRNPKKLRDRVGYWPKYRVFKNEPRHLIRAIAPSVADVIFGQRLGILAVDNAMAGHTDFMVSQWLTEYVLIPLKLVVLGRKRVPQNGIFWKSVLANTGQPDFSQF